MSCILTIDLEDYKHATMKDMGLAPIADPEQTARGVDKLLELLTRAPGNPRCTFFTTGQVANEQPELIGKLAKNGHEIGCHTYEHEDVALLDENGFDANLGKATKLLEQVSGRKIYGFRAPNFSVSLEQKKWFFTRLIKHGYVYDSSIQQPVSRAEAPSFDVISTGEGDIYEFPIYTTKVGPLRARVIGGTFFRLFPLRTVKRLLRESAKAGYVPMIYLHSADLDSSVAGVRLSEMRDLQFLKRYGWALRQKQWTVGGGWAAQKLRAVLEEFPNNGPMIDVLNMELRSHNGEQCISSA